MKRLRSHISISLLFGALLFVGACTPQGDPFLDPSQPGITRTWQSPVTGLAYSLVFNDEFEHKTIDRRRWGFRKDDGRAVTRIIKHDAKKIAIRVEDEASTTEDGNLVLSVYRKKDDARSIFTGGINTRHTFRPRYGYFETKVHLKDAQGWGHWPAFWLYFASAKDKNSIGTEIDIFEYIPREKKVHQTIHWYTDDKHHSKTHSFGIDPTVPHVVALEWTEEELIFYFDGQVTQHLTKRNNPKYVPSAFQMVFYSMSAGTWGGNVADKKNPLPASSRFEYCRVYQTENQKALYSFDGTPMIEITAKDRIAGIACDAKLPMKKHAEQKNAPKSE